MVGFGLNRILLCCLTTATALQSQYEATCFEGCKCDRVEVKCVGLRETTTEVFRHVISAVFPDLDTVIVTGNNFGDLPAENLFGGNVRHSQLSFLNLSYDGITSFGSQTLIGASRVEILSLAHNQITDFLDAQPLNFLTSLKVLDLSAAFGSHVSANKKADLVRTIFRNNHSFTDLYEVNLSGNRLILNNNQLSSFEFDEGCLEGLTTLELRQNRILSVSSSLWKNLPSLSTLDFSKNPLRCDCQLQDFHEFALDEVNSFLSQQETVCEMPRHLKGKSVFEVEENFCRGQGGLFKWLVLLCVASGVFYVYRWFRKSGKPLKLNFFTGYTQLHSNETPPSQPAFV